MCKYCSSSCRSCFDMIWIEEGRRQREEKGKKEMKRCNVCATTKQTHFAALQFEEHTYSAREWEPKFVQFLEKQGRRIRNIAIFHSKNPILSIVNWRKKRSEKWEWNRCADVFIRLFLLTFFLETSNKRRRQLSSSLLTQNIHRYTLPCFFCGKWKFCNLKTCLSSLECV